MNFRHLTYFVALAERLNFTAAAKHLGIAQPPLSVQIRKLESEMGGPLFYRDRRKIRLTPLGLLLLDESRELLRQADQAMERLSDAAEGRAGQLRIGYTRGAWSEQITRRLRKFLKRQRGVRFLPVALAYAEAITPSFATIDALITETFEPPFNSVVLERSRIEIAVSPKHRLSEKGEVFLTDLVGEPILMPHAELRSPPEKRISKHTDAQKLAVPVTASSSDLSERLWLVSLGLGLGVCSSADRGTLDAVRIPVEGQPELHTVCLLNPDSRAVALPEMVRSLQG